jgi:hypothetical protein
MRTHLPTPRALVHFNVALAVLFACSRRGPVKAISNLVETKGQQTWPSKISRE